jgi:hypothetical protein
VAAMGAAVAVAYRGFDPLFQGSTLAQGVALACLVAAGAAVYGLGLQLLGVARLADLKRLARGR